MHLGCGDLTLRNQKRCVDLHVSHVRAISLFLIVVVHDPYQNRITYRITLLDSWGGGYEDHQSLQGHSQVVHSHTYQHLTMSALLPCRPSPSPKRPSPHECPGSLRGMFCLAPCGGDRDPRSAQDRIIRCALNRRKKNASKRSHTHGRPFKGTTKYGGEWRAPKATQCAHCAGLPFLPLAPVAPL